MPLHQILWEANQDLAEACWKQPFVQDLGEGTLNPAAFRCYVAQDAYFLRAFLRAYALGAAKSDTLEQARCFQHFMGGVLEELELHGRYAASLGIDLNQVRPLTATSAYTDFLLRTAWGGDLGEIVAAMAPCMRLYAWLGQRLLPSLRDDHPYRDWIVTYASADFAALAQEVETLLNAVGHDKPVVRDAYRYAMVCERQFFAAPLAATRTGAG
ncbi:MAG: TenA family protein [Gammaproteobacteria bacterium]|nr:TenA family protein [Gammaproteobacteria bacterium]MCP5424243.1 TenA family protein [Gammaproteobacteria bacterium]MCP5458883.1 TenA family protein [Gammaproteobacteria bacterium]